MKRFLPVLVVWIVTGLLFSTSCKKGVTDGVHGRPDDTPHIPFDTFTPPDCDYFFYGKFDGHYRSWCDGKRSPWDSASRVFDPLASPQEDSTKWSTWATQVNDNIYYNFCDEEVLDFCSDSISMVYQHHSEFNRPGNPEDRLELFFYDCIDPMNYDTIEPDNVHMRHGQVVTSLFIKPIAQPFSDEKFGRYGAKLVFTDENRETWTTEPGSGQLADTYLRITDFYPREIDVDTLDTFGMYIVEGVFAGRLYNSRREMTVTEAQFRARLVKQTNYVP